MIRPAAVALLALVAAVQGCGLKGPLYLPEKSKNVVIRPAGGTAAEPAEAGTPAAPADPPATDAAPPTSPPPDPLEPSPGPGRE